MKRVLITGISGVGKSTVIDALSALGYRAVDLDGDAFSHWVAAADVAGAAGSPVEPDRDWVWREDRVLELLSVSMDKEVLFVSGSAANMGKFLAQFDQVILLSAPAEVILERLATRMNNSYGKRPGEAARVLDLIETVEPLLRKAADYEIDTSASLEEVVAAILRRVQGQV